MTQQEKFEQTNFDVIIVEDCQFDKETTKHQSQWLSGYDVDIISKHDTNNEKD